MNAPFHLPEKYHDWAIFMLNHNCTFFGGILRDRTLKGDIDMVIPRKHKKKITEHMNSLSYVTKTKTKIWYSNDIYQQTFHVHDVYVDILYIEPKDMSAFLTHNQDFTVNSLCFNKNFGIFVKPNCPYSLQEIMNHIKSKSLVSLGEINRVPQSFLNRTNKMFSKGYTIDFNLDTNVRNYTILCHHLYDLYYEHMTVPLLLFDHLYAEIMHLNLFLNNLLRTFPDTMYYVLNDKTVPNLLDSTVESILFYDTTQIDAHNLYGKLRSIPELFERAIDCNYPDTVTYLLRHHDPNCPNLVSQNMFFSALRNNHVDIVDILRDHLDVDYSYLKSRMRDLIKYGTDGMKPVFLFIKDNDPTYGTLHDFLGNTKVNQYHQYHPHTLLFLLTFCRQFRATDEIVLQSLHHRDADFSTSFKILIRHTPMSHRIVRILNRYPYLSQLVLNKNPLIEKILDQRMRHNKIYWYCRVLPPCIPIDLFKYL